MEITTTNIQRHFYYDSYHGDYDYQSTGAIVQRLLQRLKRNYNYNTGSRAPQHYNYTITITINTTPYNHNQVYWLNLAWRGNQLPCREYITLATTHAAVTNYPVESITLATTHAAVTNYPVESITLATTHAALPPIRLVLISFKLSRLSAGVEFLTLSICQFSINQLWNQQRGTRIFLYRLPKPFVPAFQGGQA